MADDSVGGFGHKVGGSERDTSELGSLVKRV